MASLVQARVAIVGRGRLGTTLHIALIAAGIDATLITSRPSKDWAPPATHYDICFLAVPDSEIGAVARRVLEWFPGSALTHLSGACGLDAITDAVESRTPAGSFHPFVPFPAVRDPDVFRDVVIGVDASSSVLRELLVDLAEALGAVPRRVPSDRRALYHAAAVVASAHLVALAAQATTLLRELEWTEEESIEALLPLMREALANLACEGLPHAITGPLRRGDHITVRANIDALAALDRPEIVGAYVALAATGLDLAEATGLNVDAVARVRRELSDGNDHRGVL